MPLIKPFKRSLVEEMHYFPALMQVLLIFFKKQAMRNKTHNFLPYLFVRLFYYYVFISYTESFMRRVLCGLHVSFAHLSFGTMCVFGVGVLGEKRKQNNKKGIFEFGH